MKNSLNALVFFAKFAVLGLALAFVLSQVAPNWTARIRGQTAVPGKTETPPAPTTAEPPTTAEVSELVTSDRQPNHGARAGSREQTSESLYASFADAVARAAPGVVSISANKIVAGRRVLVPSDPLLRRFVAPIDAGPVQRGVRSLGSGVIVRVDGYVLTNNHVIEGAEDIEATLSDGRVAKATRVGADPETDLAVLKLDIGNVTNMTMSHKRLRVGDVVLAIGNPFGHGNTVTMGIVSGLGRQLDVSAYEEFIQTDAAINEGNSGGALIDSNGDLVGINTAFTREQKAEGVGFAIPIGTARNVLNQLVSQGKVIRGWIGAEYIDQTAKAATAQAGVIVQGVYPDSPAASAGLRAGDVILRLNDEQVSGQLDLYNREASIPPGSKVQLAGLRDGNPFTVEVKLGERPTLPVQPKNG
ncbi:MAG TPA: trypsin-like peptidase domain-containing protein [Rudaea sp.]|jgi:serine protease DegQ|nr:trypsin-like peptidase domain-containing protein [Rudaea sp.]